LAKAADFLFFILFLGFKKTYRLQWSIPKDFQTKGLYTFEIFRIQHIRRKVSLIAYGFLCIINYKDVAGWPVFTGRGGSGEFGHIGKKAGGRKTLLLFHSMRR